MPPVITGMSQDVDQLTESWDQLNNILRQSVRAWYDQTDAMVKLRAANSNLTSVTAAMFNQWKQGVGISNELVRSYSNYRRVLEDLEREEQKAIGFKKALDFWTSSVAAKTKTMGVNFAAATVAAAGMVAKVTTMGVGYDQLKDKLQGFNKTLFDTIRVSERFGETAGSISSQFDRISRTTTFSRQGFADLNRAFKEFSLGIPPTTQQVADLAETMVGRLGYAEDELIAKGKDLVAIQNRLPDLWSRITSAQQAYTRSTTEGAAATAKTAYMLKAVGASKQEVETAMKMMRPPSSAAKGISEFEKVMSKSNQTIQDSNLLLAQKTQPVLESIANVSAVAARGIAGLSAGFLQLAGAAMVANSSLNMFGPSAGGSVMQAGGFLKGLRGLIAGRRGGAGGGVPIPMVGGGGGGYFNPSPGGGRGFLPLPIMAGAGPMVNPPPGGGGLSLARDASGNLVRGAAGAPVIQPAPLGLGARVGGAVAGGAGQFAGAMGYARGAGAMSNAGALLGSTAAVAGAGFVGYQAGKWLDDKFKLSDRYAASRNAGATAEIMGRATYGGTALEGTRRGLAGAMGGKTEQEMAAFRARAREAGGVAAVADPAKFAAMSNAQKEAVNQANKQKQAQLEINQALLEAKTDADKEKIAIALINEGVLTQSKYMDTVLAKGKESAKAQEDYSNLVKKSVESSGQLVGMATALRDALEAQIKDLEIISNFVSEIGSGMPQTVKKMIEEGIPTGEIGKIFVGVHLQGIEEEIDRTQKTITTQSILIKATFGKPEDLKESLKGYNLTDIGLSAVKGVGESTKKLGELRAAAIETGGAIEFENKKIAVANALLEDTGSSGATRDMAAEQKKTSTEKIAALTKEAAKTKAAMDEENAAILRNTQIIADNAKPTSGMEQMPTMLREINAKIEEQEAIMAKAGRGTKEYKDAVEALGPLYAAQKDQGAFAAKSTELALQGMDIALKKVNIDLAQNLTQLKLDTELSKTQLELSKAYGLGLAPSYEATVVVVKNLNSQMLNLQGQIENLTKGDVGKELGASLEGLGLQGVDITKAITSQMTDPRVVKSSDQFKDMFKKNLQEIYKSQPEKLEIINNPKEQEKLMAAGLKFYNEARRMNKELAATDMERLGMIKQMREGYLDAFKEAIANAGAFGAIIGLQSKSVTQLFRAGAAPAMRLGALATPGLSGVGAAPVFTKEGKLSREFGPTGTTTEVSKLWGEEFGPWAKGAKPIPGVGLGQHEGTRETALGGRAAGGPIDEGAYVVKQDMASANKNLLSSIGAQFTSGGIPGQDSIFLGGGYKAGGVLVAPGEAIVPPEYAGMAEAINSGAVQGFYVGGKIRRIGEDDPRVRKIGQDSPRVRKIGQDDPRVRKIGRPPGTDRPAGGVERGIFPAGGEAAVPPPSGRPMRHPGRGGVAAPGARAGAAGGAGAVSLPGTAGGAARRVNFEGAAGDTGYLYRNAAAQTRRTGIFRNGVEVTAGELDPNVGREPGVYGEHGRYVDPNAGRAPGAYGEHGRVSAPTGKGIYQGGKLWKPGAPMAPGEPAVANVPAAPVAAPVPAAPAAVPPAFDPKKGYFEIPSGITPENMGGVLGDLKKYPGHRAYSETGIGEGGVEGTRTKVYWYDDKGMFHYGESDKFGADAISRAKAIKARNEAAVSNAVVAAAQPAVAKAKISVPSTKPAEAGGAKPPAEWHLPNFKLPEGKATGAGSPIDLYLNALSKAKPGTRAVREEGMGAGGIEGLRRTTMWYDKGGQFHYGVSETFGADAVRRAKEIAASSMQGLYRGGPTGRLQGGSAISMPGHMRTGVGVGAGGSTEVSLKLNPEVRDLLVAEKSGSRISFNDRL